MFRRQRTDAPKNSRADEQIAVDSQEDAPFYEDTVGDRSLAASKKIPLGRQELRYYRRASELKKDLGSALRRWEEEVMLVSPAAVSGARAALERCEQIVVFFDSKQKGGADRRAWTNSELKSQNADSHLALVNFNNAVNRVRGWTA